MFHRRIQVGTFIAALLLARTGSGATVKAQAIIDRTASNSAADNSGVVVWLTSLSQPSTQVRPTSPNPKLVQKNKRFTPHLLVIPVGTVVDFPNEDPFFHNVFSLYKGKVFDLGLYEAGKTRSQRFDRPGVSFVFCNIHPQMSAAVLALSTPFYGISNRDGEIVISGVPAGRYQMDVWSEHASADSVKTLSREVSVSGDFSIPAIHVLDITPAAHKNKYGKDYDQSSETY